MPRGSMLKYFRDTGGQQTTHGEQLHWPGTADGFPLRGSVAPDLKQREFEDIPLALDFHSDTFDMTDQQDRMRFDAVMDRIVNGWYLQHHRDNFVDKETGHRMVDLEWVQVYGETPHGKVPGVQKNENPVVVKEGESETPVGELRTIGRASNDSTGFMQFE